MTEKTAAELMSSIIYVDMELEVSASALERMIKQRWSRIAPLAHKIHDAPDNSKYSGVITSPVPQGNINEALANKLRTIASGMELNGMGLQAMPLREIIYELEARK